MAHDMGSGQSVSPPPFCAQTMLASARAHASRTARRFVETGFNAHMHRWLVNLIEANDPDQMAQRIAEAGIVTDDLLPRDLMSILRPFVIS